MQNFKYDHLPPKLQEISIQFSNLAQFMVEVLPDGDEREHALRKLLESKDCAVRARLEDMDSPGSKVEAVNDTSADPIAQFEKIPRNLPAQAQVMAAHTPLDKEHAALVAATLYHAAADEEIPGILYRIVSGRYVTFDPIDSFYSRLCGALQKHFGTAR